MGKDKKKSKKPKTDVFQRKETKYLLTLKQYKELLSVMEGKMILDKYGKQTVNNVYFDADNFELISRSIEKPVYKEKVRMRVYGVPCDDSLSFFELKKKFKGIVYKRRINAPLWKVMKYIEDGTPIEDSQIFREIDYLYKRMDLKPKVYLAYDRAAYYGEEDEDFRMTFDTAIRYRFESPTIMKTDETKLLLPPDVILLETKCQLVYPDWLIKFLNDNGLFKVSFSKYGTIYQEEILKVKELKKCIA